MTRLPSVAGEPEQYGLVACVGSFSAAVTPDCHIIFPSARSKHNRVRLFPIACVTKTSLARTTGVELPGSGSSVFQRMFWLVLQAVGRFFSVQMPMPCGPRHSGQLSATTESVPNK